MKKPEKRSAFFYFRALLGFCLCFAGLTLVLFAFTGLPGSGADQPLSADAPAAQRFGGADHLKVPAQKGEGRADQGLSAAGNTAPGISRPMEGRLTKSGKSFDGDVRALPIVKQVPRERPEMPEPPLNPTFYQPPGSDLSAVARSIPEAARPIVTAPAPAPLITFDGLDRQNWGAGSPPDTNGDVGPNHYIQSVNTSVGIYNKTGAQLAAFTFNTLMSQGNFGNLCDTDNFGDPVVLYDSFEDRWVITDFAFKLDANSNTLAPAYQCFAVSKTGDPVAGGWNFYSVLVSDALNDYPKLGVWTDGIYMSSNLFSFGAGSSFQGVRVWAFNKAQMYAGAATVQVVSFNAGTGDFTVVPSNARLQTGTPPAGRPNLFVSTWNFTNAVTVYKFSVNWTSISLSSFTGPDVPLAATSWPNASVANAAQPGTTTLLDVLQIRAMVQNQYTNYGGTESLWVPHTVRRGNTTGFAAPRWYQVNVTGGTVAANLPQAATWDPDGTNVVNRFMPSLALDRAGNMALGYSVSSSTVYPSMKYAGRLAADPINTFSYTEQTMFTGSASQTGTTRWGDYSSMTLDSDGCTFWYTNEYANPDSQDFDKRWKTRIGSFAFPECTPVGNGGNISGIVTDANTNNPLAGATVSLGARTATTNGSGTYQFTNLPAGTYPSITASFPGYQSPGATSVAVSDSTTTPKNFALTAAPASACVTDTTQADFQTGIPTNLDLTTSPGDVLLSNAPTLDQQNTSVTTSGFGFSSTAWAGQTFQPAVTGSLTRMDLNLFCSGCTGTTPNITVSIRATASDLPTGADLATATIPGFNSGAGGFYTATFTTPAMLTAGTRYAVIFRAVSNPSAGTYAYVVSTGSPYANGRRVTSTNSGSTWTGQTTDIGFRAYMQTGYAPNGDLISGTKDANPAISMTPVWGTFSWTANVPPNTALRFQAAASNNAAGPFNYVGPDMTNGTYFTSGDSLNQFNGNRYLRYRAFLSTSNGMLTPTLNDATVCFTNTPPPPPNQCDVCHKRQTISVQCSSLEYQRHLDHGDFNGPCPGP